MLLVLVFTLGACSNGEETNSNEGNLVGDIAYDFTLENLEGNNESLSDYRGQVVFLNFWASWCPPCQEEMPDLDKFYADYKDENFMLVAVNVAEEKETVVNYLNENNFEMPVLFDKDGSLTKKYGVQGIPKTFILNKDGEIITMKSGAMTYEQMENYYEQANNPN
jgi:thiol-disulfide isomerase/thioredoxin